MEAAGAAPSRSCCEGSSCARSWTRPSCPLLPRVARTSVHVDGLLVSASVGTVPITVFIVITRRQ